MLIFEKYLKTIFIFEKIFFIILKKNYLKNKRYSVWKTEGKLSVHIRHDLTCRKLTSKIVITNKSIKQRYDIKYQCTKKPRYFYPPTMNNSKKKLWD